MDSSVDKGDAGFYDQERCYKEFGTQVLQQVKQGFNTAVFAYGQTGSGKTTSMVGDLAPPENQGLLPRLLRDAFIQWNKEKAMGEEWKYNLGKLRRVLMKVFKTSTILLKDITSGQYESSSLNTVITLDITVIVYQRVSAAGAEKSQLVPSL
jgi:hypothetical protein